MRTIVMPLAAILSGACVGLAAQSPAAPQPSTALAFDVTSVKPNTSGERGGSSSAESGRYAGTNVTLLRVIALAYSPMQEFIGGPGWVYSEHFDIHGRTDRPVDRPQVLAMMRTMLADRFKLRVRRETRQLPAYALTLARADRRLGPQLVAAPPCTQEEPAAGQVRVCGGFNFGLGSLRGNGVTMEQIARELPGTTEGRQVFDRTGLSGAFDVALTWNADAGAASAGGGEGVSIFSALQEQLGLKLESITAPVDVLVIDSAERPEVAGVMTDRGYRATCRPSFAPSHLRTFRTTLSSPWLPSFPSIAVTF